MSIGLIFMMALASVAGFLIVAIRIAGFRRVLRHATAIDVVFTLLVCFLLAGTITGLLIGIVAGLIMTGTLTVCKWVLSGVEGYRAARAVPIEEPEEDWCPGGTATELTKGRPNVFYRKPQTGA